MSSQCWIAELESDLHVSGLVQRGWMSGVLVGAVGLRALAPETGDCIPEGVMGEAGQRRPLPQGQRRRRGRDP